MGTVKRGPRHVALQLPRGCIQAHQAPPVLVYAVLRRPFQGAKDQVLSTGMVHIAVGQMLHSARPTPPAAGSFTPDAKLNTPFPLQVPLLRLFLQDGGVGVADLATLLVALRLTLDPRSESMEAAEEGNCEPVRSSHSILPNHVDLPAGSARTLVPVSSSNFHSSHSSGCRHPSATPSSPSLTGEVYGRGPQDAKRLKPFTVPKTSFTKYRLARRSRSQTP